MKIERIKIKNFRSYREETTIDFGNFTAFVGKNDAGKSTILEALDIFFNDSKGVVKLDKDDVNTQALRDGDTETVISVCFSGLPEQIIIDASAYTTLADEYMLNTEGMLEVVKKYKNGGKVYVFIRARHPINQGCSDLLYKKNTELKKFISDDKIDCDNLKINSEMRKAIWKHYGSDLNLGDVEIDASKEDAKKIWEKLSGYMPVYSLFKSDRENNDDDDEVQDPMKEAVKQILNDEKVKSALSEIAETVERRLKDVAGRTLEKLRDMDSAAAESLKPVIPSADKLRWAEVFKGVSISGDEDIPIKKRGSGVKRLVLLSFFRAEAERTAEEGGSNGIIYAIEEPETSQHPNNQRILINALKRLADKENVQVIITTHNTFIVKELDISTVRLICEAEEGKSILEAEPPVLQRSSLNEVNYIAYGEASNPSS